MFVDRKAHIAVALALALTLGGCVNLSGGVVRSATIRQQVAVTDAFITPPPGGPAIIAVFEDRYSNALAQDIVLQNRSATAGQNAIILRAYGPMGYDAGVTALDPDAIDLATIRGELGERFPGVRMEISGLYAQNRYGPFSFATGRSRAGANCVYAWQRIAAAARVFSFQRGAITWRLRVCDDDTDTRTLLLLAYGLTINGYFLSRSWNPYGDPPPVDPRIGVKGEAILPEQFVDPTVIAPDAVGAARVVREAPRRTSSRRLPVARRAAEADVIVAPRVLNAPLEGAAVIPRPENTDLSEPSVRDSNLPQTGTTAARPRVSVPLPPAADGSSGPAALPQRSPRATPQPTPLPPGTPAPPAQPGAGLQPAPAVRVIPRAATAADRADTSGGALRVSTRPFAQSSPQ